MKLEEEIQQTSFKNEYLKVAINLLFTSNWINYHNEICFRKEDLTVQQYNVLRILRGQYPTPCNQKLIKARMLDRMSDVSRIVDKLCAKGLVQKNISSNDRRNVDVIITLKGIDSLSKLDYIDDEFIKLFSNLGENEVNTLNVLLDKIRG